MKTTLIPFLASLVTMLMLDGIWLSTMVNSFYKSRIGHLMGPVSYAPAVLFYLLYNLGVLILVVQPALQNKTPLLQVFLYGAVLGFVAYGTYDLTNQATLKNWPSSLTVVDLLWGGLLTGLVACAAVWISRY